MKLKKAALLYSLSLGCAVGIAGNANANLVTNGNFETGNLTGWTASNPGTDPQAISPPIFAASYPAALGGTVVDFGGGGKTGGSLSQSITTESGQSYVLAFDYGGFQAANFGQPQSLAIEINSTTIDTITDTLGTNDLSTLFNHYSFVFVANSALTTLTFRDVSNTGSSSDGLLDNVSVTVPEPGSLALLGIGLFGMSLGRRKRGQVSS